MKAHIGKTFEQDRVELDEQDKLQLRRLMDRPEWKVFVSLNQAKAGLAKRRLYHRSLSGTKDFDAAPLVAFLAALESVITIEELDHEG